MFQPAVNPTSNLFAANLDRIVRMPGDIFVDRLCGRQQSLTILRGQNAAASIERN
jgi:hypothetical protein